MTSAILILAAAAAAAPASAAPPPAPAPIAIPRELTDPAMPDKLGRMAGAMAHAVMNMPVGEMEAAIENRPVTPADRNRRVRDVAAADDRAVVDQVASNTAATGHAMQAATRALVASLPAIMSAVKNAEAEIERATANLPDPSYPRR